MRNKMKQWRKLAAIVKRAVRAKGLHQKSARYGKSVRVAPAVPVWRGGPPSLVAPSPLLSGLLKRQASL